jgi:hypothetical protein
VNLLAVAITDYTLEFRNRDTNETVSTGTIVDNPLPSSNGAFRVFFTPTLAGKFNMYIKFNGLDVDSSPYEVTVSPAGLTHAPSSTIVNINSMVHTTGDYIVFVIESRDLNSNLRNTSTTDVYSVKLIGESSATIYTASTPVANNNGTYTASFMFTIAESYTLKVQLNGVDLKDTPI